MVKPEAKWYIGEIMLPGANWYVGEIMPPGAKWDNEKNVAARGIIARYM